MHPDPRQWNPSCSARGGALVSSHQAPGSPQPAAGPFDHPPLGQHGKSLHVVATLADFDCKLGPSFLDPVGAILTRGAAGDPNFAQSGQPASPRAEHFLRSVPFGATGWSHHDPKQQTQGSDPHMALAPLAPLACILAHRAAVPGRLGRFGCPSWLPWAAFLAQLPSARGS